LDSRFSIGRYRAKGFWIFDSRFSIGRYRAKGIFGRFSVGGNYAVDGLSGLSGLGGLGIENRESKIENYFILPVR
jgi:hypothetical protein